jgi:hypothetical protein
LRFLYLAKAAGIGLSTDMTDLIRYDLLAQEALRGVVKKVLSDVAKSGLPGDHHFFVGFSMNSPGVKMSERLRQSQLKKAQNKDNPEMTIVLQHQFWDLIVGEKSFEVGLSFQGVPERIVIPFDAINGFFDPSVQFGLQFETVTEAQASPGAAANEPGNMAAIGDRRPAPRGAASEPEEMPKSPAAASRGKKKSDAESSAGKPAKESGDAATAAPTGAQVVSLDKFRKK